MAGGNCQPDLVALRDQLRAMQTPVSSDRKPRAPSSPAIIWGNAA